MPPKSTDKKSKQNKVKSGPKQEKHSKDSSIIETTYEKVLSIINNVKDFIKKNSKNSKKLIEDLEWVIKVIANKSLYSYELKKPKFSRQNSEFNKFVNFVTKFNEEIIEMKQKHILVSGLLNIVGKGEILKKPSLCLKKILPEELKLMDYQKEKEKKSRKKNLIYMIGNAILNLYYKSIEKQKKDAKEGKIKDKDKTRPNGTENSNKNNDEEDEISKISTNDKNRKIEQYNRNKKNNIINNNQNNITINNFSSYSCGKRKNINNHYIKLTKKNEKLSLKTMKNALGNYYSNYILTEQQNINEPRYFITKSNLTKNKSINKNNNNSNRNIKNIYLESNSIQYKNNKNKKQERQKGKNKSFELRNNNEDIIKKKLKNYYNYNNHSNSKNNKKNYIHNNSNFILQREFQTSAFINNKSITNKINNLKTKKIISQKNINRNNKGNSHDIQKKINEINVSKKEEKINLNSLIDNHFNDMKNIIDKDFDIFDFKSKVGHRNVLPLMCYCILKALGLLDKRIITLSKLESFLYSINDNYKESTFYHNSLHGADVTQSLCVFFINSNAEQIGETSVLDLLGMILSAMGHDLGHPGFTNNFHINASTDLALTYNDISCLENFHCSFLFKILKKDENNIIQNLSVDNYKYIRKRMIRQILATDMANHGEVISLIRTKIKLFQEEEEIEENESKGFILLSGNEKTKFDEQQVLLNYLMHMADLGHNCKKYEISKQWVKLLCEEFWIQGDKEKQLGIPVSFLCNRDKIDVPASQVNFLRGFIISSFDSLVEMFPKLNYTMENAKNNIDKWQKLLEQKRVTGWTPKNEKKDDDQEKE